MYSVPMYRLGNQQMHCINTQNVSSSCMDWYITRQWFVSIHYLQVMQGLLVLEEWELEVCLEYIKAKITTKVLFDSISHLGKWNIISVSEPSSYFLRLLYVKPWGPFRFWKQPPALWTQYWGFNLKYHKF